MAQSINEADHLFRSSPGEDIKRYEGENSFSDRIEEWFETPMGTMAHHPSWGHNLAQFKHDPQSRDLPILMEMAVAEKLPIDIADIVLKGISVTYLDIDLCKIVVLHQFGYNEANVNL